MDVGATPLDIRACGCDVLCDGHVAAADVEGLNGCLAFAWQVCDCLSQTLGKVSDAVRVRGPLVKPNQFLLKKRGLSIGDGRAHDAINLAGAVHRPQTLLPSLRHVLAGFGRRDQVRPHA